MPNDKILSFSLRAFFICGLCVFSAAFASSTSKADMDKGTKIIIGINVFLNETSLLDVLNRLGKAENIQSGDASGFENKICYRNNDPVNPQAIEFVSGEIGGGRIITLVRMYPFDNKGENARKYFLIDKKNEDISTAGGLRIGVTKEWILKKFGNPNGFLYSPEPGTKRDAIKEIKWDKKDFRNDEWTYYYHSQVKVLPGQRNYQSLKKWEGGKEPFYDITATITLNFKNDKVVFVNITRIETT